MSRKDDVDATDMRRDAEGTSPTHSRMSHNAQKWHMTLAAPLYLPFAHGRFVDFLHRYFLLAVSNYIASNFYERRIA